MVAVIRTEQSAMKTSMNTGENKVVIEDVVNELALQAMNASALVQVSSMRRGSDGCSLGIPRLPG